MEKDKKKPWHAQGLPLMKRQASNEVPNLMVEKLSTKDDPWRSEGGANPFTL